MYQNHFPTPAYDFYVETILAPKVTRNGNMHVLYYPYRNVHDNYI